MLSMERIHAPYPEHKEGQSRAREASSMSLARLNVPLLGWCSQVISSEGNLNGEGHYSIMI
jgi:hypothetical protein